MKMMILLLILLSNSAWGKTEHHVLDKTKHIQVYVPHGWESVKDLYGVPLTILGPWANESRPVIMFVFTNLKKSTLSKNDFQNLFENFNEQKEKWVKSHKGQLIKYEPKKVVVFRKDFEGHYIGAEFKINDIHFVERSYYLYCKDEIYNLKYSIRDEHRVHLSSLHRIIEEFRCE
jgi:hypothetical protein